ncbi:DNA primase [Geothermobacter hydrogeniphilus]|uniref:DNA primase n=1 Tax=Geothermobacter hydrogeniphilus TaxID=1969733 RepID=A0A2K2HA92_9BACT|nr:DNA primase [Geothermobacter hydrogeniphilus]PNU20150.1 DNA primase [Geothermobacter hydrogeniphilus]
MGRIPEEIVERVRDRVDIVELVARYVALKRSGVNNFGLCPFHSEKSPSFNVNSARQIFHCFGCGEGGNAITFLMKIEGLGFKDAVRRLAGEAGIEIAEERLSPEQEAARRENEKLRRLNEVACGFYQQMLLQKSVGGAAQQYLNTRGYGQKMAQAFQLGYAPDRWDALLTHLREKGLDIDPARRLGLVRPGKQGRGDYDLFRGRLIFPIFDHYGQVVAFGGRILSGGGAKYINSPESPIYHKSRVLYGLYRAKEAMRRSDMAIVVEGYFDVLAMHRAGITQAVATCGTALTLDHARLLKRYAQKLVLLFDQDQAGQTAALRAMEVALPEGLEVQIVNLAPGEDPDSFLAGAGREAFDNCLARARPVLEWYMDRLLVAGSGVSEQARGVDEILQRIGLLPGEIERSLYLKQLAGRTGLAEDLLQRKLGELQRSRPVMAAQMAPPLPETFPVEPSPSGPLPEGPGLPGPSHREGPTKAERMLLHLLLVNREFLPQLEQLVNPEELLHPDISALVRVFGRHPEADPADLLESTELDGQQKEVLSGILKENPDALGDDLEAIFANCRKGIEDSAIKKEMKKLKQRIAQVERSGPRDDLVALNRKMTELGQRLKGADR